MNEIATIPVPRLHAVTAPALDLVPEVSRDILRVEGLSKSFGQVPAVRGVDLQVGEHEFVGIIGRSGSGKSTLLFLLAGLETPDEGHVYWQPSDDVTVDVARQSEDELALWRRRSVGVVFQSFHLIPTLSALENVAFPLYPAGVRPSERRARALRCLEQVGLGHRASHRPTQLSGGEQQRVAIARALVGEPALLLADEPTGNLDSATGAQIIELFGELHRESGVAMVIVTHDEKVAAAADRVLHMADGRIAE